MKATTALSALNSVLAGLKPETPLVLAVQMLRDNGLTGAAVLDDAGQPIGVLAEESCLRFLVHDVYERAEESTVGDVFAAALERHDRTDTAPAAVALLVLLVAAPLLLIGGLALLVVAVARRFRGRRPIPSRASAAAPLSPS